MTTLMLLTYLKREGPGHPDEADWDRAKKMADFLEHFHDLTVRVSSSLHVTSVMLMKIPVLLLCI